METWQEWYLANQTDINREAEQSNATDIYDPQAHEALECTCFLFFFLFFYFLLFFFFWNNRVLVMASMLTLLYS